MSEDARAGFKLRVQPCKSGRNSSNCKQSKEQGGDRSYWVQFKIYRRQVLSAANKPSPTHFAILRSNYENNGLIVQPAFAAADKINIDIKNGQHDQ